MHTNKYRNTKQYSNSARCTLAPMTNDTRQIIEEAMKLTEKVYQRGIEFGKAGIYLDDLRPTSERHYNLLFDDKPKSVELMQCIDAINQRHGRYSTIVSYRVPETPLRSPLYGVL